MIDAGIMSATFGVLARKLLPGSRISIYECLDRVAAESSDAWNNAGTMEVIASIEEPVVIRKILDHLREKAGRN